MYLKSLYFIILGICAYVQAQKEGYRSVVYFVNWGVYARNWIPQNLPVINLTHVFYAFASINSMTGEVSLTDRYADVEKRFPGDSVSETGNNLYGSLKQLYLLKKQRRTLKVLLSIGGYTFRENFAVPVSTVRGRETFAKSAIGIMADTGFDGLDIDWEYPENESDARNLVLLLQTIRESLDIYGSKLEPPYRFQLTVTSSAGPEHYKQLRLADMAQYVDFWNLMAFDYAGAQWSDKVGNQANLFASKGNPASTPFDTEAAVQYYTSRGVPSRKIVLGMPLYGRSFVGTDGLGKTFDHTTVDPGTWERGVYDFKDLPLSGAVEQYDDTTGSSWSYDTLKKNLISYDIPQVAVQKATWIQQMELGGAMWWESSADGKGDRSLISTVVGIIGGLEGSDLEGTSNCLDYPHSSWDNLRAGMPEADAALNSIAATSCTCDISLLTSQSPVLACSFTTFQTSTIPIRTSLISATTTSTTTITRRSTITITLSLTASETSATETTGITVLTVGENTISLTAGGQGQYADDVYYTLYKDDSVGSTPGVTISGEYLSLSSTEKLTSSTDSLPVSSTPPPNFMWGSVTITAGAPGVTLDGTYVTGGTDGLLYFQQTALATTTLSFDGDPQPCLPISSPSYAASSSSNPFPRHNSSLTNSKAAVMTSVTARWTNTTSEIKVSSNSDSSTSSFILYYTVYVKPVGSVTLSPGGPGVTTNGVLWTMYPDGSISKEPSTVTSTTTYTPPAVTVT